MGKVALTAISLSNIKMIMEVYAHPDEEKEAVQDKLNAAIAL